MFDKSTDHGNEVTVAQFVYSFSRSCDLPRNFNENACQNFQYYFKKTDRQQLFMVRTLIDHRNDFKMFKTLQLSFQHFDVISIRVYGVISIRVAIMGNCCQLPIN